MFDFIGNIGGLFHDWVGKALSWVGAEKDRKASQQQFDQNLNTQKEFAQNSIQWKAADAKKAGIHPLYAMGSQAASYTPMSYDTNFAGQYGNAIPSGASVANLFKSISNSRMAKLNEELLQSQIEAQKIANMNAMQNMGQNSNQQNQINDGLSKMVVQDLYSSPTSAPKSRLKESFNPTPSTRYSGGDYSQAFDEFATENALASKVGEYLNMPQGERKKIKVDLLRSLGQPGLRVVPKDDLTSFDYWFYNKREQVFRFLDKILK
ncbi:DNA pilot protein [Tortoise microvirus 100]|nr:DNA pilot protein [Tortoise microvirus 100]